MHMVASQCNHAYVYAIMLPSTYIVQNCKQNRPDTRPHNASGGEHRLTPVSHQIHASTDELRKGRSTRHILGPFYIAPLHAEQCSSSPRHAWRRIAGRAYVGNGSMHARDCPARLPSHDDDARRTEGARATRKKARSFSSAGKS